MRFCGRGGKRFRGHGGVLNVTCFAVGDLIGRELKAEYDLDFCLGVRVGNPTLSSSS